MSIRKCAKGPHEVAGHQWCQQVAGMLIRSRKARGWSQAMLGTQLGLSQSVVAMMERSPCRVPAMRLYAALRALDMEIVVRGVQPDAIAA